MPTLAPSSLFRRPSRGPLPEPLGRGQATLWFAARNALHQATPALGLAPGQIVAVPALCCGTELEPFLHRELRLRFYRVDSRLQVDLDSLRRVVPGCAAVMVTHFLGFPSAGPAVSSLCDEYGAVLIEDCAHALGSRDGERWLGTQGDAAVFSPWKTVAMPDGGVLLLNQAEARPVASPIPPPLRIVRQRTRSLVMRHLHASDATGARWLARGFSRAKRRMGRRNMAFDLNEAESYTAIARFRPEWSRCGMSSRAETLLRSVEVDFHAETRRRHYAVLDAEIRGVAGVRPVHEEMPPGVCPMALPVIVEDPDDFQRRLNEARIGVKRFWPHYHNAVPWEHFPFEADLKRRMFLLPVHQGLSEEEMRRIIAVLRRWARA